MWWWCYIQLVRYEVFNGIGDCYVINQQDWVDSEEVEQGNQFICVNIKVFFYNFGDVFVWVFIRQYEVSQVVVSKKCYWECKDSYDDQWDYIVNIGVDWQEQYVCVDCCVVKVQYLYGVCFVSGIMRVF